MQVETECLFGKLTTKEVKFIVQEIRWEQIMKCDLFNQGFLEISNVVKRDWRLLWINVS